MSTKRIIFTWASLAILVVAIIGGGCGGDKSTGPAPAKSYPVYLLDGSDESSIYRYYPTTQKLEKLPIEVPSARSLAVSAGGGRLYVSTTSGIVVLSTTSYDTIATSPYTGGLVISPDDRFLAVLGSGLRILGTTDLSVIYHSTTSFSDCVFSSDGERLYHGKQDSVCAVEIADSTVSCHPVPVGFGRLRVSEDESVWYTYNQGLVAFDTQGDSVICYDSLGCPGGYLESSPNGRWVYFTSGWPAVGICEPLSAFRIYDQTLNEVTSEISTVGIRDGTVPAFYPLRRICFTPDSKFAILESAYSFGGPFVVYDIPAGKIVAFVEDEGQFFRMPVCQAQR